MSLDTLFALLTTTRLDPVEDTSLVQATDQNLEKSPTYNWDGATMTADVGGAIPVVYGRHLVPPNLINVFVEEGENETLNMLLAVCEGEIDSISNIKLNGASIENYIGDNVNDPYGENSEVSVRYGTLDQTAIDNFDDIHTIYDIGETMVKGMPYVYTTYRDDCEAFKIEFLIERLFQVNEDENQLAWYVALQIEYKLHTDTVYKTLGIHEFSKNTTSSFKRYFKSGYLPAGKYDIRVTRVSDNSDSTHIGEVYLNSIDEIISDKLSYPTTALIGIRVVASEKLSDALPNVTCIVNGLKVRVPDVRDDWDRAVNWEDYYYDGTTNQFKMLANDSVLYWNGGYTTAWTANPVWCLRDFLLNTRYGLGDYIDADLLDDDSFLACAKYCDEAVLDFNGKKEKRMRLDIVFDTKEDALEVAYRICSTFRGILYLTAGQVRLIVEKQQDSVYLFTMGNIVKNSFSIRYISKKASVNVLECQYTDVDKNYARETVEVGNESDIASGTEINTSSVQFIGVTRVSQVIREATILLNKQLLNTLQISFTAGIEASSLQIGDVFEFQHDLPSWGQGGRVQAGGSRTVVKLDKPVTIELGKSYEIEVKDADTDTLEVRTVAETNGVYTELTTTAPFSFVAEENDIWSFGEVGYRNKKYRIISLSKAGRVSIQALEYHDEAYDFSTIKIPESHYEYLTLEIPNVSNLVAVEKATRLPDGTIDDVVNISYQKPPTGVRWVKKVTRFEIYVSDDNGKSWNFITDTDKELYVIKMPFTVNTPYKFSVVSVTESGEKKLPANSPQVLLSIQGWKKAPSVVSVFTYTFTNEIVFKWGRIDDQDLAGYELRTNDNNWGVNDANFVWRGDADSYTVVRPTARTGVTYFLRAYNSSGIYAEISATVSPINPAPLAPALTHIPLFQKVFLMWNDTADADFTWYEIWENDTNLWSGVEQDREKISNLAKGTSAVLPVPYNPTFFRIRAVDKFGGGDWSNVVEVNQIPLVSSDIGANAIKEVNIADDSISAPKIIAGAIMTAHLSALAVTADKINVNQLSAITADMGKLTAGEIVGALIKTSEGLERTEINNAGLFGYNSTGALTIKLSSGELCLIDPTCNAFYSYLDHGALKFKHPYGTVPYVKRVQAGSAQAGSTVVLCQWYEHPEITVSIRKMMAYNSVYASSCQDWCVYGNNTRFYDNGGGDFGWLFDIHAKLVISGGTRPECIYLANFDVTKTTGTNTCQILVKEQFQLWCHGTSPDNFRYGKSDYEVRYRVSGCAVWCACCYSYTQPHSTISEMGTTFTMCQTVNFGGCGTYEVALHENTLTWYDSGIASGYYQCLLCCFSYQQDASYWYTYEIYGSQPSWQRGVANRTPNSTQSGAWCDYSTYGSIADPVCYSRICYNVSARVEARVTYYNACANASVVGQYGGSAGISAGGSPYDWWKYCTYGISGGVTGTSMISQVRFTTSVYVRTGMSASYDCAIGEGDVYYSRQWLCVKCCRSTTMWCCYWYCVWVGNAECCNYKRFYSMQEIVGGECVLDSDGMVSWLAVAYA